MKALALVVLEKMIFKGISHHKSMGANESRGVAIFDPRARLAKFIENHYTLLHTK